MAKPLSDLYAIFSKFAIHGGSPAQLVRAEPMPTRFSDMLVNRPDPLLKDVGFDLGLLEAGCQMLLIELCHVHGTYGRVYGVTPSKGEEGGFYLTALLDGGPNSEMSRLTTQTLEDLGWPVT